MLEMILRMKREAISETTLGQIPRTILEAILEITLEMIREAGTTKETIRGAIKGTIPRVTTTGEGIRGREIAKPGTVRRTKIAAAILDGASAAATVGAMGVAAIGAPVGAIEAAMKGAAIRIEGTVGEVEALIVEETVARRRGKAAAVVVEERIVIESAEEIRE